VTKKRSEDITRILSSAFAPTELLVKDQSHLHAGHQGAADGKGHFEVTIISDFFEGYARIERHRMVYDALGSLMESEIHALRINAFLPSER
jgi:BolA protein